MAYGRGHVVKGAKQRQMQPRTKARLQAMGAAIQQKLSNMTTQQLTGQTK